MQEILRIEKLCMSFGDKEVLKNINLVIYSGEIFALIGPSGAGKTTLLRILNFFEKPSSGGFVFLNGNSRKNMSLLFQTPAVFNTSVFNNVAYGLKIRGTDNKTIEKKVRRALELVGLEGKEKQKARTLSGGETQRMVFARAIVYKPGLLLLDEPTSSLDPVNVARIEELIKEIRHRCKTTIIIATHNIPQVRRISDRVGIILNGEIIEVNSTEKLFSSPEDVRTSKFLRGEMIY